MEAYCVSLHLALLELSFVFNYNKQIGKCVMSKGA